MNIQIIDSEKERREETIKFISKHQGCSITDVVKDATENGYGSKKTIEKTIEDLKKENIVRKEKRKRNSRNYNLFIDEKNLDVIETRIFEQIEKKYNEIIKKMKSKVKEHTKMGEQIIFITQCVHFCLVFPNFLQDCYTKKAVIFWSKEIQVKELFEKLTSNILHRLIKMQIDNLELFRGDFPTEITKYNDQFNRMFHCFFLFEKIKYFTKYAHSEEIVIDFEKEYNDLLELVWQSNKIQCNIMFDLPFDEEDMKELEEELSFDLTNGNYQDFKRFIECLIRKGELTRWKRNRYNSFFISENWIKGHTSLGQFMTPTAKDISAFFDKMSSKFTASDISQLFQKKPLS